MIILLSTPRGFCAGVSRAIEIAQITLDYYKPKKIYIKHEIVHNKRIVDDFITKGAIFVNSIDEIPNDSVVVFSAHGSSISDYQKAEEKNITIIEAVCPLVLNVHKMAQKYEKENAEIILIGHKNHIETIGTIGNVECAISVIENIKDLDSLHIKSGKNIRIITQTTLSVDDTKEILDELFKKFSDIDFVINSKPNICYATQNRQDAIKKLIERKMNKLIVVGSKNSSNSNRLAEIGIKSNIQTFLIDSKDDLDIKSFKNNDTVGITAGASAHEDFVQEIVFFLKNNFIITSIKDVVLKKEDIVFHLPKNVLEMKQKLKNKS